MTTMYILCSISVLLVALFLIVRVLKGGPYGILTKILASFAFMVVAIVGAYQTGLTNFSLFVILGLLCGLIGDFVLDNKVVYKEHENIYLNAGMLSFGIGHIFYFVAATAILVALGKSTTSILIALGIAIVLTAGTMFMSKPMKLNFGKFFYQTLAYTLILTFMSAYSVILAIAVPELWTFAVGICLIFLSDLILSTQYFGGKQDNKLLIVLNHAIYYLGQIFIAATLFLV